MRRCALLRRFFFMVTATTAIYTLSLHDALPIFDRDVGFDLFQLCGVAAVQPGELELERELDAADVTIIGDRKSTRLNSSHSSISYAVFCLKKKRDVLRDLAVPVRRVPHRPAARF